MRRRIGASLLIALGLTASVTLADAPPARALSCSEPLPLRARLAEADVVFIGTVVGARKVPGAASDATLARVRVDRPLKGTFAVDAEIAYHWERPTLGEQAVYLPYRVGSADGTARWVVSACGGVEAVAAVEAAMGPPPVTGSGPLRHVALVPLGDARVVALDGSLRPLGYGAGSGVVASFAVCPGGRRGVEVVADARSPSDRRLAVRDLRTLAVVSEIVDDRLVRTVERPFDELTVACRSASGDDLAVFLGGPSPQGPSELHRWRSGRWSTPWTGPQKSAVASVDGRSMYLVGGPDPLVVAVDTATGRRRIVASTETSLSRPRLGPDGGTLQVWTATGHQDERFLEVRLDDGTVSELPRPTDVGTPDRTAIPDLGPVGTTSGVVVAVPSGPRSAPEHVPGALLLGSGATLPAAPDDVEWTVEPAGPMAVGGEVTGAPSTADAAARGGGASDDADGVSAPPLAAVVATVAATSVLVGGGVLIARRRRG